MKSNQNEIKSLESDFLHNYDTRLRLASIETSLNQIDKPLTEHDGDL